jgi:hypothetical protein
MPEGRSCYRGIQRKGQGRVWVSRTHTLSLPHSLSAREIFKWSHLHIFSGNYDARMRDLNII